MQQYICRHSRILFLLFSIDYHYYPQIHLPHQIYYRISSLNKSTSNPNNNTVSHPTLPNGTIVFHNTLTNTVSHNTFLNGTIVSNNTVTNGHIVSHSTVSNGNILSNSIETPENIVTCNIVDKSNLSLLKHVSYSFPSASIRNVNGIDFTFHSHLYFDAQHWITSLLLLLRQLVSSFRLERFLLFSRHNPSSCLSLKPYFTIPQASFPTWQISTHSVSSSSFGSKLPCYRSLIHGSSCHLLSHSSFTPNSAS